MTAMVGFRAAISQAREEDLGPDISRQSASATSPRAPVSILKTREGSSLFYDPTARLFKHARSPRKNWRAVHLWSADGLHGLLCPDGDDALDLARPVRVRFLDSTRCVLLSAKCGVDELIFSAKPGKRRQPGVFVEMAVQAGPWEELTTLAATKPAALPESALRAFCELIETKPSPAGLLGLETDETALRWFLAFQDYTYLDSLGAEAVREPGHAFMRRVGAGARDPGVRRAYKYLAEWIEGRDSAVAIEHLGPEYDILEPWPTYAPFTIDFEIIARMRQHIEPRKGACVLATMRNEGPYVLEWLAYHQSLGFEHFFIYTNDNSDASDALLDELAAQGQITLIKSDARNVRPQFKAYGHAFKALPQLLDYEWVLVIDCDEFLVLAPDGRFPDIKHYADWISARPADAVTFNWLLFNAFGIEEADLDEFVTRRFARRLDHVNPHVKTLARPRYFVHSHAHYPFEIRGRLTQILNSNGDVYLHHKEKAHSIHPVAEAAWINHYWTKSAQEFCGKLARRSGDLHSSFVRPLSEIAEMLGNVQKSDAVQTPIEDRRIFPRLEATQARVSELLANPAIRAAYEESVARQRQHLDMLSQQIAEHRRRARRWRWRRSRESG